MPRWQALQYHHLLGMDDAFGIGVNEVSGGARILPQEGERGGAKVIVGLFVEQQQPVSPEGHRARMRCLEPACEKIGLRACGSLRRGQSAQITDLEAGPTGS